MRATSTKKIKDAIENPEKDIEVSKINKGEDIPVTRAKSDFATGTVKIKALTTIRSALGAFNKDSLYFVNSTLAQTLIDTGRAERC